MLRKIKLYGELATFVGHKEFEVKADTLLVMRLVF